MSGESFAELTQRENDLAAGKPAQSKVQTDASKNNWVTDNVVDPFVNGSGLLQVYDTLASKPAQTLHVAETKAGTVDWAVQTAASTAGAIVPYVIAGKLMGAGMGALSRRIGAEGAAATFLASEGSAQVLGAGAYDALKKPHEGESRIGNSVGTMAGFSVFTAGNGLVGRAAGAFESTTGKAVATGLTRFAVGTVGGEVSYDVTSHVANITGGNMQTSWSDRVSAMASGGLLNFGLPIVHGGVSKALKAVTEARVGSGTGGTGGGGGLFEKAADAPAARIVVQNSTTLDGGVKTISAREIFAPVEVAPVEPVSSVVRLPISEHALVTHVEATPKPTLLADLKLGESKIARIAEVEPEAPADNKVVPFDKTSFGLADPLGATLTDTGVNFAVASRGATKVELHIFADAADKDASQVLPMYKSGDIWHRSVDGLKAGALYLYNAEGNYTPQADGSRYNEHKLLIDPYSKAVSGDSFPLDDSILGYDNTNPTDVGRHLKPSLIDSTGDFPKSVVVDSKSFDWQGVEKPHIPESDEVAYEVHLKGFTAGDASLGDLAGTFRGFTKKIPFMKDMGYTTVEVMPIMQSDKSPWFGVSPVTGDLLKDSWAYNTVAYQAPDASLAHDGKTGQQVNEFKEMVRELHRNGMEILLDIVFNHTREGNAYGPTISLRGLDNNTYYMSVPGHPDVYVDHTGCGNTVNTNHPQVEKLIMDTLRYWVQEMGVDGFRFDLASVFKYDVDGQAKYKPPVIAAMENDPVLSQAKVKLVSEPWGIDRYDFGNFSEKRWAELNGPFRDTVRSFVKSDPSQISAMATQIAGTPALFDASQGRYPINMVTNHDGFTLNDVVTYNEKHNEANGENNRDGNSDNKSWNGGVEGPVEHANISDDQKASIEALRTRQIKNMFSMLFLSRGVPMVLYGDEMRRTTMGNNNTWNQDKLNTLDWSLLDKNSDMVRFTKMMIELRKSHQIGRSTPDAITWHGVEPYKPDWSPNSHFLAWQLAPASPKVNPLFSAFNAYWEPLTIKLPPGTWSRLVDTNLPSGQDIVSPDQAQRIDGTYVIQPRSGIVLEGKPEASANDNEAPSDAADVHGIQRVANAQASSGH